MSGPKKRKVAPEGVTFLERLFSAVHRERATRLPTRNYLICTLRGCASGRFGRVTLRTPSLSSAST